MAVLKTGGKPATTHYKTLKTFSFNGQLLSLLECNLETGRTHQIRVHLSHIGHALVGDPVYGQSTSGRLKSSVFRSLPDHARDALAAFNRQALHAKELGLIHPATGKPMRFSCELPADMASLIAALQ